MQHTRSSSFVYSIAFFFLWFHVHDWLLLHCILNDGLKSFPKLKKLLSYLEFRYTHLSILLHDIPTSNDNRTEIWIGNPSVVTGSSKNYNTIEPSAYSYPYTLMCINWWLIFVMDEKWNCLKTLNNKNSLFQRRSAACNIYIPSRPGRCFFLSISLLWPTWRLVQKSQRWLQNPLLEPSAIAWHKLEKEFRYIVYYTYYCVDSTTIFYYALM